MENIIEDSTTGLHEILGTFRQMLQQLDEKTESIREQVIRHVSWNDDHKYIAAEDPSEALILVTEKPAYVQVFKAVPGTIRVKFVKKIVGHRARG